MKNKEIINDYTKRYYQANKERLRLYKSNYFQNNKETYLANNSKRRALKINATPKWSENDKIKVLYEKAKWLESLTGLKYHVDHIIPLNSDKVCGLHVWSNLQILEESINLSKSNWHESSKN